MDNALRSQINREATELYRQGIMGTQETLKYLANKFGYSAADWYMKNHGSGSLGIMPRDDRNASKRRRNANLPPLKKSAFLEWVDRNLYPRDVVDPAHKAETNTKRRQRAQRDALTRSTGVPHEIDHVAGQPTGPNAERIQAIHPGDASVNREPKPAQENRTKSNKKYMPKVTRSSAIRRNVLMIAGSRGDLEAATRSEQLGFTTVDPVQTELDAFGNIRVR